MKIKERERYVPYFAEWVQDNAQEPLKCKRIKYYGGWYLDIYNERVKIGTIDLHGDVECFVRKIPSALVSTIEAYEELFNTEVNVYIPNILDRES